jgi:hypothetical protein
MHVKDGQIGPRLYSDHVGCTFCEQQLRGITVLNKSAGVKIWANERRDVRVGGPMAAGQVGGVTYYNS